MSPFRRLFGYVLRYRRDFLLGLICVVGATAIMLVSPIILRYAVDDLTSGVTRAKLFQYGSLLLAVGLVGGVFRFLMRRILIGASRHIEYNMRNDFFAHLEKLPLTYFQTHRTGDLMSRATNDLNAVRMMIGPSVMYSANTLLTFVVALVLMVAIDPRLTLLSLIPLPFVSFSVWFFGTAIHKRFEQIQAQLSEISAIAQEALSGVRVVRAYRQESEELDRFRRANAEYVARNRRLIALQGFFFPSMAFFLGLGALLVLWLGSREVILGRITLGEFVAFNAYLTMLSWPMIAFGWVTNMLQRGMASWKRMLEVLDTEPAIADATLVQGGPSSAPAFQRSASGLTRTSDIAGDIDIRDLVFAHNGTVVLDHVSLRISAGQTVALVGVTGSGKSTLISLLPRLYDPPRGTVFIDGVDVLDIPLGVLRRSIGFVAQEPFLFSTPSPTTWRSDSMDGRAGREGPEGQARPTTSACGHAEPRTSKSEPRRRRQFALGVGPRRQWKMTSGPAGSPMRPPPPDSTRTPSTSRTATTRWWGSAASRCQVVRNSARRSRAPLPSIPAS